MMNVLLQDRVVKTRKVHPCVWCGEAIEKGESVPYRAYTYEDGIASEWWHPECMKAMATVPCQDIEEGYVSGEYYRGTTERNC